MALAVFPSLPGLTYTVGKSPEFNTLDQAAPNRYEVRIAQSINPVWHFTMIFDFLRDFPYGPFTAVSELRTLMGFFLNQRGMAGSFLFTDPDDCYVGPALVAGAPNTPLAQLQILNDGAGNFYSPVRRTLDGNFYEDVTDLNGAITVYANGVLKVLGTDYTVAGPGLAFGGFASMGLYLKWTAAAPAWQAAHAYALNAEILDPAGHLQKATTAGTSGTTIPTFNDAGGTTPDPSFVVWTDQGKPAWAASTAYALGAMIVDAAGHIQKITTAGTSGTTIPTFNDAGGTTTDNTAVWTDGGTPAWAASTAYALGAVVLDASSHIQKATTAGTSGTTAPTFSDTGGSVNDPTGSVVWTDQGYSAGPAGPITAQFHYYFRVRFDSDSQDFEKFTSTGMAAAVAGQGGGYWTVGGSSARNGSGTLKLVSARPVPL